MKTFLLGALLALAPFAWAQGFSFDHMSSRFITPNGDGKNDAALFFFNNPNAVQVTGKIYDIRGNFVATMIPVAGQLPENEQQWNGKGDNGQAVRTGVYIYVVTAEDMTYRGVVVVIR